MISLFGSQIGNVQSAVEGFSGITTGVLSELGKLPKGFKSATKSAVNFRKDFKGSLKGLGSAVTGPFQVLTPKLSATVGKIGKVVSGVPGKIGGAVGKIGSAIASKIPRITSAFSLLGDTAGYLGNMGRTDRICFAGSSWNSSRLYSVICRVDEFRCSCSRCGSRSWTGLQSVWYAD